MNMGAVAIAVVITVMTIIIAVILTYVFKDTIVNDTGLDLSNDAKADIESIFGYAKIAFTFLGLGLVILASVVLISYVRSMQGN